MSGTTPSSGDDRPVILVFAGSLRQGSFNRRLAALACQRATAHGADAQLLELADYPMPLYDGDLEEAKGLPDAVRALKARFVACDGLFIASPEYNGFFTPLLKNTVDWLSRRESADEPPLAAFADKTAALAAASPGALGGLRVLPHLRVLLSGIGVQVLPKQLAVGGAGDAFADDGSLKDGDQAAALDALVGRLVDTCRKLRRD